MTKRRPNGRPRCAPLSAVLLVGILFALSPLDARIGAQSDQNTRSIVDRNGGGGTGGLEPLQLCGGTAPLFGYNNAVQCNGTLTAQNGTLEASGSIDQLNHAANSAALVSTTGTGPDASAYSQSQTTESNVVTVLGQSGVIGSLQFHFAYNNIEEFLHFTASTGDRSYELNLTTPFGSADVQGKDNSAGVTESYSLENAVVTPIGLDLTIPVDAATGTFSYSFFTSVLADLTDAAPGEDPSIYTEVDAQLSGLDALDANGNVIQSATRDVTTDHWVLDFPPPIVATPEPASLTLMATGLVALGGVVRRRRTKVRDPE